MEREEAKSLGYASAAVLIWSTVATAFKLALREMSPEQVIFIASGVSLLFFMVYLASSGSISCYSKLQARNYAGQH